MLILWSSEMCTPFSHLLPLCGLGGSALEPECKNALLPLALIRLPTQLQGGCIWGLGLALTPGLPGPCVGHRLAVDWDNEWGQGRVVRFGH